MQTTDFETAAESLLIRDEPVEQPQVEEQAEEAPEEVPTEEAAAEPETEAEEQEVSEDESEADDAGPRPPERLTVKVDGKDVEVSIEDLKRSYSGNAYIQKGMQEAADAKKQAQAILEALHAEQQRFTEFAQQVQSEGFRAPPKAPDPALARTDPIAYVEAIARHNEEVAAYQSQQTEIQRYTQAQRAMSQQQRRAHLEAQAQMLAEKIPGYADPDKGKAIREGLRKTAQEYGFSDAELQGIDDARTVQVLHDAYQWRQLQSVKAKVTTAPPKNLKPAGKRPEPPQLARQKQIEQAKRSGRLDDWSRLLLE